MGGLIAALNNMKGSKVSNYVIAGLDSFLINKGTVRLFENSRRHLDEITPHSHRFNLTCLVVKGEVSNSIWRKCREDEGDLFRRSEIKYNGVIGEHVKNTIDQGFYTWDSKIYKTGEIYSMLDTEIHSINFSKDSAVLIFEEPSKSDCSCIIEPIVDGVLIPTYKKEDYMFIKAPS